MATFCQALSLLLSNSPSLHSSFSKDFFKWIKVVAQDWTSNYKCSLSINIIDFFGHLVYSTFFASSKNFLTCVISCNMKTLKSFMPSIRKQSSSWHLPSPSCLWVWSPLCVITTKVVLCFKDGAGHVTFFSCWCVVSCAYWAQFTRWPLCYANQLRKKWLDSYHLGEDVHKHPCTTWGALHNLAQKFIDNCFVTNLLPNIKCKHKSSCVTIDSLMSLWGFRLASSSSNFLAKSGHSTLNDQRFDSPSQACFFLIYSLNCLCFSHI